MEIKYTVLDNGYIYMEKDGLFYTIPNDPSNSDYQAYLEYLTTEGSN